MPSLTETTPAVKTIRKPRPKPARSVRILEQPTEDTGFWGALEITVGKETDTYLIHFIPSDFGNGAVGFEVEKLDADLATVEAYHVHLAGQDTSCTCPGFSYHQKPCKHVDGLVALAKAGALSVPEQRQKHAACPRCCERVDAPGLCLTCRADEEEFAAYHEQQERAMAAWDAARQEELPDVGLCPFEE